MSVERTLQVIRETNGALEWAARARQARHVETVPEAERNPAPEAFRSPARFVSGSKEIAVPQRNGGEFELPFGQLAAKLANVPAEPPWTWEGYVAPEAITLLAGRPKAGKSTLVFGLLAAVLSGEAFLERPTKHTGALMLSEERQGTLADKARRFSLGGGLHLLMLHEAGGVEWPDVVEQAADYCELHSLGLLVVDVFDKWARFRGDAENNAGDVNAAVAPLAAAAARGLAVLLVSHHRKAGGQYGEAVRGSNALTGAADVVAELERPAADVLAGDGARVLRAVSRWQSTPGELVARLEGDEYRAEGSTLAVRVEAERERVRETVETLGEATVGQVAQTTELPERTVRRHLEKLEGEELARAGEGKRGDPFRWRPLSFRHGSSSTAGNETAGPFGDEAAL